MKVVSMNRQRALLLPMLVMIFPAIAFCQQYEPFAKNTAFVEWSSQGPLYSVNYDRIIRQGEKMSYSIRAGFSLEKKAFSFPVGFSALTGAKDHHAEFSLLFIPYIDQGQKDKTLTKENADKYVYINPGIGYRYQKSGGGLFIKVAAGPSIFLDPPSDDFWKMDPKLDAFVSAGVGFSF